MAKSWNVSMAAAVRPRLLVGEKRGLLRAGRRVLAESQQHVPYDTGELHDSGYVEAETPQRVAVGYRSSKAAGAHENLTATHAPGRSAKYLENAFNNTRDVLLTDIVREIRDELGT
jgi:hypothetical protein